MDFLDLIFTNLFNAPYFISFCCTKILLCVQSWFIAYSGDFVSEVCFLIYFMCNLLFVLVPDAEAYLFAEV